MFQFASKLFFLNIFFKNRLCIMFEQRLTLVVYLYFLQNITGLWILQRLMSEWKARGEEQHYDTIIPQAAEVETDTIIPVDAPEFMNPENMETALMNYCRDHSLHIPQSKAETVKCVLQSLAFKYQHPAAPTGIYAASPDPG